MIRVATVKDIPAILDLAGVFWEHTVYEEPFDRAQCYHMVNLCLSQGLLAVIDDQGIQGFVAGVKAPLIASSEASTGTELAYWVNPNVRGSGEGKKLLYFIEDLAREQGIKYWNMVSMESSNPELANALYERMGYKKVETTYQKVL